MPQEKAHHDLSKNAIFKAREAEKLSDYGGVFQRICFAGALTRRPIILFLAGYGIAVICSTPMAS